MSSSETRAVSHRLNCLVTSSCCHSNVDRDAKYSVILPYIYGLWNIINTEHICKIPLARTWMRSSSREIIVVIMHKPFSSWDVATRSGQIWHFATYDSSFHCHQLLQPFSTLWNYNAIISNELWNYCIIVITTQKK